MNKSPTATLMTRRQAAELLGISVVTLDVERNSGRLAYIQRKPRCKVWITEEAIAEYLARVTRRAKPDRTIRSTWQLGSARR